MGVSAWRAPPASAGRGLISRFDSCNAESLQREEDIAVLTNGALSILALSF